MNSESPSPDDVVPMIACEDCGHMVPEANLAIHHATACGGRARAVQYSPPSPEQQRHPELQAMPMPSSDAAPSAPPEEFDDSIITTGLRQRRSTTATLPATPPPAATTTVTIDDTPPRAFAAAAAANPKSDDDDDYVHVPRTPTRDVMQVGDVVDLTDSSEKKPKAKTEEQQQEEEWACPRCTLLNHSSDSHCSACRYSPHDDNNNNDEDGVRAADPTRRDRLVNDPQMPTTPENNSNNTNSTTPLSGALLGSVLGAAGAYMRGRDIGSGAIGGAMTGFVGGALVGEVLRDVQSPDNNGMGGNGNVAAARSGASMGLPTYPSLSPPANAPSTASRRMQPRQSVRVVRSRNGVTTTIYTSGGEVTQAQMRDPLMDLMMRSLVTQQGIGHGGVIGGQNVDGMSYEQLLQAFGDGTEHLGADEGTIRSLPVATVESSSQLPQDQRQCAICLEDFSSDTSRKTLPCLHGFHEVCVDKWLRSNGSCPICKNKVA